MADFVFAMGWSLIFGAVLGALILGKPLERLVTKLRRLNREYDALVIDQRVEFSPTLYFATTPNEALAHLIPGDTNG